MKHKRSSLIGCTRELTMLVDHRAMDDDEIAVIRKRLRAARIRLKLVTSSGSLHDEEPGV